MQEWLGGLKKLRPGNDIICDLSDENLVKLCQTYPGPILAIGHNPPPPSLRKVVTFHPILWKGRFLCRKGIQFPGKPFEYTPGRWHPTIVNQLKKWLTRIHL